MTHTFNVNFTTSYYCRMTRKWLPNELRNKIIDHMRFLEGEYNHFGYLYLNIVHRFLGMVWSPYDENKVFIRERDGELTFDVSDQPVKIDGFDTIVVTMVFT